MERWHRADVAAATTRADVAMLQLGLTWLAVDLARVVHEQNCGCCTAREIHARNFQRHVWARANSDEAVYGSSGTVVFRGFQRYIVLLKTTRRERTEKDRADYVPEKH